MPKKLYANEVIYNNSTDNYSITSSSLDITSFTCVDLGANTVVLTVTDQSGKQNTANATVTVEDTINPVAIGQDITIDLVGNASVSIVVNDVDNGSFDNCGIATLDIDIDTFTAIGDYPVVLIVTDSLGNTFDVAVIVTIVDSNLSVDEVELEMFEIFPNLTTDILYINFELRSDYSFSLYDISGKEILRQLKLELNNTINFSKYDSGVYILKINDEISNKFKNVKIVKL